MSTRIFKKCLLLALLIYSSSGVCQTTPYTWEWAREAYTSSTEFVQDAAIDPNTGDLVVVGEFTGDISASYGLNFVGALGGGFVARYNSAGTLLWAFKIGENNNDRCKGVSVDNAGNIYVTGYLTINCDFRGNSAVPSILTSVGGRDLFIAKYTSAGMYVWAKIGGGVNDDEGLAVTVGGSNVYVTGYYHNSASFGTFSTFSIENQDNVILLAYNVTTGAEVWLADAGASSDGYGYDVVANVNNVFITGSFKGNITFYNSSGGAVASPVTSGNGEAFTASYTNTGAFNWVSMVTGGGANSNYSLTLLGSNVYITGGIDNISSFTGYASNPVVPMGSNNDFFVAQLNATTGTTQWVKCEPGNNDQEGMQITNDGTNIIACGYLDNTMTFAAGPTINSVGNSDVFVAKYTTAGNFVWVQQAGGGDKDVPYALACIASTEIYVGGEYKTAATFGAFNLFNENSINIFVAKLSCPPITNNTVSASQTICSGLVPAGLNGALPTGGSSPYVYLWEESLNNVAWSPASGVNNTQNYSPPALSVNTYYRRRVTSSGGCLNFSNSASLLITVDPLPTTAAAGADQTLCASSTSMLGNAPTTGTGLWTQVSGPIAATITTPASNTTTITGMTTAGAYVFQWTITSGTCPASSDQVTINVDPLPTVAAAGVDQTLCASSTSMLGNAPTTGTGLWTQVSGPIAATITTPASNSTTITGMTTAGAYVFQWTITSGTCPASSDQVTINVDPLPTVAAAGVDQTLCASSTSLVGNTPTIGTGLWTLVSGTGTITTPTSPTSGITAMSAGANVFRWTITNGTCPASFDLVTINVSAVPTTAAAGPDQAICASTTSLVGNTPTVGTGLWTLVSGTGTITTPTSPTSGVTGMTPGVKVFRWTISNGTCTPSFDQVTVTVSGTPTTAAAGADQAICSSSTSLAGNTPTVGTGLWTLISGTGTITTPTSPTSGVTGMTPGVKVFRWTISNGPCAPSFDQVTVTVSGTPTTAAAGADQAICSSSTSLAGNTPTIGTGLWTLVSGTGTITTPTSPTSGITGMSPGANIFRWTITNGTCPASSDQVTINVDPLPTVAAAGVDQTLCASSTSMLSNAPTTGTGLWTQVSGPIAATITTPASNSTTITGMTTAGAYVFQWTITSGTCPASTDQVTINVDPLPTVAAAGVDQTLCASSTSMLGNAPTTGTGLWTQVSGPIAATITTPASNSTTITGMTTAGAYVFQWTITSGTCPSSSDQVTINVDPLPTAAAAGVDQTLCASSTSMLGNAPTTGTGLWTQVSGPIAATITAPASNSTTITGMTTAGAYVFQWTITSGTCPASSDQVTVNVDPLPTVAAAGVDQTLCASSTSLVGNAPTIGTGLWTLVSGTGTITTSSSPTSGVTGMFSGTNVFQWAITNGTCPTSFDTVVVVVDSIPTPAMAGTDHPLCSSNDVHAGNTPTIGSGTWSLVSGSGITSNPTSPTSPITGMFSGANTFAWTITNGTCPASIDSVTITVDSIPTPSLAGTDQTICSSSTSLLGNTATVGTGIWTVISGAGTITTSSSPTSGVTGMFSGTNVFQWAITNGTCPTSFDTVVVAVDSIPTPAMAGTDHSICSSNDVHSGNTPTIGSGTWSLVSGSGITSNPTSPTSPISGMLSGANTFAWTITNGTCPASIDSVTITVDSIPTPSLAGTDQTICSSSTSLLGNTATIGVGIWTVISGAGTITTSSSPTSGVTGMFSGTNVFQWAITNGTCPTSFDTVVVAVDSIPTPAMAGTDHSLCSSNDVHSGNTPTIGSGTWSLVSGSGTCTNPTSAISPITGMLSGPNSFVWTITNGTCPASIDSVTITVDSIPTPSLAGADQTICSSSTSLLGNTATIGTGIWTVISGAGTITTSSSPTSGVTGMFSGTNVFQWAITNGTCPTSFDTVVVAVDSIPNIANAGVDQQFCSSSYSLNGNIPTIGTGLWTLLSGSGNVTVNNSSSSGITGLGIGPNVFQWTISNSTCPSTSDTVVLTVDPTPTLADAGIDQIICASSTTLYGNTSLIGIGAWNLISGSGSISSPNSPITNVNGLSTGANIYEWTITSGTCPPSSDQVSIFGEPAPTVADAGPDQTVDVPLVVLGANNPQVGIGFWEVVNSSIAIPNPFDPNCVLRDVPPGHYIFRWSIGGVVCDSTSDDVEITVNEFVIPNGFSPNGDNINDNFIIPGVGYWPQFNLNVYNRWGELVYFSKDYQNEWNGQNQNGDKLVDDTYYYILEIPTLGEFAGFVVIKREN